MAKRPSFDETSSDEEANLEQLSQRMHSTRKKSKPSKFGANGAINDVLTDESDDPFDDDSFEDSLYAPTLPKKYGKSNRGGKHAKETG